jgi:hypothetical protein
MQNFNNIDIANKHTKEDIENLNNTGNHIQEIPKQLKIAINKYPIAITNGIYFTIIFVNLAKLLDISSIFYKSRAASKRIKRRMSKINPSVSILRHLGNVI